jgi:hypothetical protein
MVERLLKEDGKGYVLKSNAKNPFPTGYKPEIDVTEEHDHMLASRYILLEFYVGPSRLVRLTYFLQHLFIKVSGNPQFGHLEAAHHIFAYLKKHPNMGKLAYDSKQPDIDERIFHHNVDWKEFYGDLEEELPPNMPERWGHLVTISAFVDANHAGNVVTRRSNSGIFLFV